jgi:hypothetical protein
LHTDNTEKTDKNGFIFRFAKNFGVNPNLVPGEYLNMKKYIFILFATALLSSCGKDKKCWVLVDCLGNDVMGYCGTENEVQAQAQANSSPTCSWSYRRE